LVRHLIQSQGGGLILSCHVPSYVSDNSFICHNYTSTNNRIWISYCIDMFAGPTERQMDIFPVRVLEMSGGASIIIFTMFQTPGINDEQFQIQYESLLKEFENLKKEFLVTCS